MSVDAPIVLKDSKSLVRANQFSARYILKCRPQRTRRGLFWALTSLPFLDYSISINLYPLNVRKEIDRTEKSLERVRGDYGAEGRRSLRLAQITQYIEQLYTDRFEEWISEDASRLDFAARHAMAVVEYKTARLPVIATFLEAWTEFRHAASEDEQARFDLTYIPESNKQLKELAGFLIANYGRQHIISLPRGKWKRVIFEEVSRTLDIAGGEQLVSEFYAQLSKFSTWIIVIFQAI